MTTLDEAAIRAQLDANVLTDVEGLEVFARIDSTNTYLRDHTAPKRGRFRVALADHQTAGRGRNENRWLSAPGRSLCLSLAHTFPQSPDKLSALSLALGVGAVEALAGLGIDGVALKWPNDLMAAGTKLGGILAETAVRRRDETLVVAGIGLNVDLPDRIDEGFASARVTRAGDLRSLMPEPPERETLAAAMIIGWRRTMLEFEAGGFERFVERFGVLDWLAGRAIAVTTGQKRMVGMASGVNSSGALMVETRDGMVPVVSGTILSVDAS